MPTTLAIGTRKGLCLLHQEKEGGGFEPRFDLKGWVVSATTRDERGRHYAAITSDAYGAAVHYSDDLRTWTQCLGAPRYTPGDIGNEEHLRIVRAADFGGAFKGTQRQVDQIWTLHAAHGRIYAGVSEAGLFISSDRGETWQGAPGINDYPGRESWFPGFGGHCLHTILTDPKDAAKIWIGISAAGFFRSDDGGNTFNPKNENVSGDTGQCVHGVTFDARHAVLLRQEHRGVYRSTNGGDTWQVAEAGLPISALGDGHRCCFGFAIASNPTGATFTVPLDGDSTRMPPDGTLAAYRSENGGASWDRLDKGLPKAYFAGVLRGAMTCDAERPGFVAIGTTAGDVFVSEDGGEAWREVAHGLPRILSAAAFTA